MIFDKEMINFGIWEIMNVISNIYDKLFGCWDVYIWNV